MGLSQSPRNTLQQQLKRFSRPRGRGNPFRAPSSLPPAPAAAPRLGAHPALLLKNRPGGRRDESPPNLQLRRAGRAGPARRGCGGPRGEGRAPGGEGAGWAGSAEPGRRGGDLGAGRAGRRGLAGKPAARGHGAAGPGLPGGDRAGGRRGRRSPEVLLGASGKPAWSPEDCKFHFVKQPFAPRLKPQPSNL